MSWRGGMGLIGCKLSRHPSIGSTQIESMYAVARKFLHYDQKFVLEYFNLNSIKTGEGLLKLRTKNLKSRPTLLTVESQTLNPC